MAFPAREKRDIERTERETTTSRYRARRGAVGLVIGATGPTTEV
jgi:hypothetical protein